MIDIGYRKDPLHPHAHAIIIPLGAGLPAATLVTDALYIETLNSQWETFSIWLLTGGLLVAALAALVLLAEALLGRIQRISWIRFAAVSAAALIALATAFVHSRDGYTAVVPAGIILSALTALVLIAAGMLAISCGGGMAQLASQYGANPTLPAPQQYLLPPMHVAPAVGWRVGETPTVAPGLRITALAIGFLHPRAVYALPNGDVLVVESNGPHAPVNRPKDYIMGW